MPLDERHRIGVDTFSPFKIEEAPVTQLEKEREREVEACKLSSRTDVTPRFSARFSHFLAPIGRGSIVR